MNNNFREIRNADIYEDGEKLWHIQSQAPGDGICNWFVWADHEPTRDEMVRHVLKASTPFQGDVSKTIINRDAPGYDEQPDVADIDWAIDVVEGGDVAGVAVEVL